MTLSHCCIMAKSSGGMERELAKLGQLRMAIRLGVQSGLLSSRAIGPSKSHSSRREIGLLKSGTNIILALFPFDRSTIQRERG